MPNTSNSLTSFKDFNFWHIPHESRFHCGSSYVIGSNILNIFQVISRQSCTTKSDVWSIGVITYILLAGYPPFHVDHDTSNASDADAILLKKILNCDYKFIDATWKDISPQAIDFIRTLMCPDANLRDKLNLYL